MPDATAAALAALRAVADAHPAAWGVEAVNYEGLRVNFDAPGAAVGGAAREGWVMVRPSLHEPILSMQIECDRAGGAAHAARVLWDGGFRDLAPLLDLGPLQKLATSAAASE
jgi:phosphomannomutase